MPFVSSAKFLFTAFKNRSVIPEFDKIKREIRLYTKDMRGTYLLRTFSMFCINNCLYKFTYNNLKIGLKVTYGEKILIIRFLHLFQVIDKIEIRLRFPSANVRLN